MIRLEYQTLARCGPGHVWQAFADLDRWSKWNPVIGKASWISGEAWNPGSRFFMEILQPRKMTFRPVIDEIRAPYRVAWTGSSVGFRGTHWHEFTEQPDGTTLVKTWEEFSGFATGFFGANMKKKLVEMYRVWLESLSRESERLAQNAGTAP